MRDALRNPIELMKEHLNASDAGVLTELLESKSVKVEKRSVSPLTPEVSRILGEVVQFLVGLDQEYSGK